MYVKNKLKYENKIVTDNTNLLKSESNKLLKLFVDKNPPEEIIVNDKLKASNVLRLMSLYNKNIKNVRYY